MKDTPSRADLATFDLKGPNADGEVWIFVDTPEKRHGFNLGSPEQVAERLSQWLASYDDGERFA
jgi:alkanesulfonate monooxygenase SsuD/methylene tetrahydromethanopterin reductase-like flavin-dependent oxidoreductase (luciferase family)